MGGIGITVWRWAVTAHQSRK